MRRQEFHLPNFKFVALRVPEIKGGTQWRRAIEALEARAPPDSIATVVNTPCPGKKVTVFSA